jgi:hypothetical protein
MIFSMHQVVRFAIAQQRPLWRRRRLQEQQQQQQHFAVGAVILYRP